MNSDNREHAVGDTAIFIFWRFLCVSSTWSEFTHQTSGRRLSHWTSNAFYDNGHVDSYNLTEDMVTTHLQVRARTHTHTNRNTQMLGKRSTNGDLNAVCMDSSRH